MRAVDCWCGQLVQDEDEDGLVRRLAEHVDEAHAGERGEDEIRERVRSRAYEPPTGDPPWAY
jgi:predicted small metal-binding protein